MSTRANIQFKQGGETLHIYRHSDGMPDSTGVDLAEFVQGYVDGSMRPNIDQSMGWLIVRGHFDMKRTTPVAFGETDISGPTANAADKYRGWKCGEYEPTTCMHGDEEFIYIIDLDASTIECRKPIGGYWDEPTLDKTKRLYQHAFNRVMPAKYRGAL